jgi:hypothetical protein
MTDVNALINRIDRESAAEEGRQNMGWAELVQANRERGLPLQRCKTEAQHIIEPVKPRLDAFIERFKAVVKAEPVVREHSRALNLTFAATASPPAWGDDPVPGHPGAGRGRDPAMQPGGPASEDAPQSGATGRRRMTQR